MSVALLPRLKLDSLYCSPSYTYQEQPTTPLSGASDKFIMLTTEVVHHVD